MLEVVRIQMPTCSLLFNLYTGVPFHSNAPPLLVCADLTDADAGASLGVTVDADAFFPPAKGLNGGPPEAPGDAAAFPSFLSAWISGATDGLSDAAELGSFDVLPREEELTLCGGVSR